MAEASGSSASTAQAAPLQHQGAEAFEEGAAEDEAAGLEKADLKIILLGDSAVGKSKLVERFLMDNYHPRQRSTFALTLFRHETTVDDQPVKVDFWDTAGQERFASMHPSYYYRAHACILCFDITRQETYINLKQWYKELRQYCESIPVICVANKIDEDMRVTRKRFKFPTDHGMKFFFVSAADGTNVVQMFQEAVQQAWEAKQKDGDFMTELMTLLEDDTLGAAGGGDAPAPAP